MFRFLVGVLEYIIFYCCFLYLAFNFLKRNPFLKKGLLSCVIVGLYELELFFMFGIYLRGEKSFNATLICFKIVALN